MNDLISVIVPAYNTEKYLEACVDSILRQTYQHIEIIIVDDGSTDRSGVIADDYVKKYPGKIKCIHQINSGVTTARIKGVLSSSGLWIGFVDSDDEIEENMYERLIKNARLHNAEISHCGHQTIVNGGERIHYFYNTGKISVQSSNEALNGLLTGIFEPSICTKIYKRSLVMEVIKEKLIPVDIKYNEDLLMNFYLFSKATNSVVEDICFYHYMARNTSATRKALQIKKALDPCCVNKIILDTVSKPYTETAWHNYLRCCLNAYISIYKRSGIEEQKKKLKYTLVYNRDKWYVLSRNEKIKVISILYFPTVYFAVYHIYEKHFQKKIYE